MHNRKIYNGCVLHTVIAIWFNHRWACNHHHVFCAGRRFSIFTQGAPTSPKPLKIFFCGFLKSTCALKKWRYCVTADEGMTHRLILFMTPPPPLHWSRIHECAIISLRFLGIILTVVSPEVPFTVFTLQTGFKPLFIKGGGCKIC